MTPPEIAPSSTPSQGGSEGGWLDSMHRKADCQSAADYKPAPHKTSGLLGAFQAAAFAVVGAEQEQGEDQAAEAERCEHDLAGGVVVR